jgi:osmotically-inducible protein OsmY
MTVDDAVDLICHAAGLQGFKTSPESQKAMDDLLLASEIKTALIEIKPDIEVFARDGRVILGASAFVMRDPELAARLEAIVRRVPGVKEVSIKSSHLVDWTD